MLEKRGGAKRPVAKDKHERILKAAVKIFAKHGFHNSKISQIAKEAGVADGTIYLYFKNKDDILINLFEKKIDAAIQDFNASLVGLRDPIEKLRTFIIRYAEYMEKHQALAEVISVELRQSNKFMKEYVPVKFAEFLQILSMIIREGKDLGVFRRDIEPGIAKRAIFGALDELILYWVLAPKPKYSTTQIGRNLADLFAEGLKARP
ncbi:MAG: TetR/AcrR family transcriptional regulator [Deltaproteobacteria bacterium]|nr:TetR/AcrR family transcriptional regulator [Deltaproteobacteria bacterium]